MRFESRRIYIGQAAVCGITRAEAITEILRTARRRSVIVPAVVMPINAQLILLASEEARFAALTHRADLCLADGMSLVMASRLLGRGFPERIAGVDLMEAVCKECAATGVTVYLLGGEPGAADQASRILAEKYAGLQVAGWECPPLGFECDLTETVRVKERIRRARPDVLFVGLGAPKQEYWIDDHVYDLPLKVAMAVGGSIDLLAGYKKRAPRWMQQSGCEWLFRLMREPRRLWRRYLVGNPKFVWTVLRQRMKQRSAEVLIRP